MKKLANLKGVKSLSKMEQKTIGGGCWCNCGCSPGTYCLPAGCACTNDTDCIMGDCGGGAHPWGTCGGGGIQ